MNFLKILGYFALTLGILVIIVALYVTLDRETLALNPLLLGAAAIFAGLLSLKRSKNKS